MGCNKTKPCPQQVLTFVMTAFITIFCIVDDISGIILISIITRIWIHCLWHDPVLLTVCHHFSNDGHGHNKKGSGHWC